MLAYFKNLRQRNNEDGFTLIELLVVILIIGILAAIAIPVFVNQRQTANNAAVESDLRNAASGMEVVLASTGTYPTTLPEAVKTSGGVTLSVKSADATGYCLVAKHENSKDYNGSPKVATWDNLAGGLNTANGACKDPSIVIGGENAPMVEAQAGGVYQPGMTQEPEPGTDGVYQPGMNQPGMNQGMEPGSEPETGGVNQPGMNQGMEPGTEPGTGTVDPNRAVYSREGTQTAEVAFINKNSGNEDGSPTIIPATATYTKTYVDGFYGIKATYKVHDTKQWDIEYFYNAQPFMTVKDIKCYPHNADADPYGERSYTAQPWNNETHMPFFANAVDAEESFQASNGNCNFETFTLTGDEYGAAKLASPVTVSFPAE